MSELTFTFPFSIPTLVVAVLCYVVMTPVVTNRLNSWHKLALPFVVGTVTGVLAAALTLGYSLRFVLGMAIMLASRERLTQTGWRKELSLLVVTLVVAILFVGLR